MNMTGVSSLVALLCEGASALLHEFSLALGGRDLVRQAERGMPIPQFGQLTPPTP